MHRWTSAFSAFSDIGRRDVCSPNESRCCWNSNLRVGPFESCAFAYRSTPTSVVCFACTRARRRSSSSIETKNTLSGGTGNGVPRSRSNFGYTDGPKGGHGTKRSPRYAKPNWGFTINHLQTLQMAFSRLRLNGSLDGLTRSDWHAARAAERVGASLGPGDRTDTLLMEISLATQMLTPEVGATKRPARRSRSSCSLTSLMIQDQLSRRPGAISGYF